MQLDITAVLLLKNNVLAMAILIVQPLFHSPWKRMHYSLYCIVGSDDRCKLLVTAPHKFRDTQTDVSGEALFHCMVTRTVPHAHQTFFLWGYLKSKVYETRPASILQLKQLIQVALYEFPENLLKCLQNQGGHLEDILNSIKFSYLLVALNIIFEQRKLYYFKIRQLFMPHPVLFFTTVSEVKVDIYSWESRVLFN